MISKKILVDHLELFFGSSKQSIANAKLAKKITIKGRVTLSQKNLLKKLPRRMHILLGNISIFYKSKSMTIGFSCCLSSSSNL